MTKTQVSEVVLGTNREVLEDSDVLKRMQYVYFEERIMREAVIDRLGREEYKS